MAACAWNMAKWMRDAILFLFALIFGLKRVPRNAKLKPSRAIKSVKTILSDCAVLGN
jgi:flagellar biogenesis protein FliO